MEDCQGVASFRKVELAPLPVISSSLDLLVQNYYFSIVFANNWSENLSILRLFFENLLTAPRSQVFNPLKI